MENKPLDPGYLNEFWKAVKLRGGYETNILKRIDYILRRIYQEFGGTIKYWYFDGAEEKLIAEYQWQANYLAEELLEIPHQSW